MDSIFFYMLENILQIIQILLLILILLYSIKKKYIFLHLYNIFTIQQSFIISSL